MRNMPYFIYTTSKVPNEKHCERLYEFRSCNTEIFTGESVDQKQWTIGLVLLSIYIKKCVEEGMWYIL